MVIIAKVCIVVVTTANVVVALHGRGREAALRGLLQDVVILLAVEGARVA